MKFANVPLRRPIYIALGAALAIWLVVWLLSIHTTPKNIPVVSLTQAQADKTIELAGVPIHVDLALTPFQQQQGLSGRKSLGENDGMLFVFQNDSKYAFWMKDMLFSIDIIWISATGTVVYIAPNATPESYPHDFIADTPARYVLELPAGWMAAHNAKIGDKVSI